MGKPEAAGLSGTSFNGNRLLLNNKVTAMPKPSSFELWTLVYPVAFEHKNHSFKILFGFQKEELALYFKESTFLKFDILSL